MRWAPTTYKNDNVVDNPEWGIGETLFLTISVTDTGVGMTPAEIKKLFHRFTQASSKTSIKYGGSGLGLFISQKLSGMQGGEIGVSTRQSKGSTFSFYVKARRAEPKNGSGPQEHRPTPTRLTSGPRISYSRKINLDEMHVLLVEDNIVNQKVLSKQLRTAGCIVHIANHGVEALDFIRTSDLWQTQSTGLRLDIILMDWEMPVSKYSGIFLFFC